MRARVLVLLACLLVGGVPAVVFFSITRAETRDDAWCGAQPGGVVRGVVQDEAGRGLAHALVELRAGRQPPKERRASARGANADSLAAFEFDETHTVRVETGSEGLFEVAADPIDGLYVLRATLDEFEPRERLYSFLDRELRPVTEPRPVVFALKRSVRLAIELDTRAGAGPAAVTYELEHRSDTWLGLGSSTRTWSGSFEGASVVLDQLLPGPAHLRLATRDGRRFESEVELAAGTLTLRARL
jgi:hypothetical protein